MLGEIKRSIINANLKKYPRQIQHPAIDLNMELLAQTLNDLTVNYFYKKIHFRCVTGSEFVSDYNKSNVFYKHQNKGYVAAFWNGDSYYQPGIYLFEVNNRNTKGTRARSEMCLTLTVRTPERRQ